MSTVKNGAELLIVSVKDTAMFLRLINPKTTVANLDQRERKREKAGFFL